MTAPSPYGPLALVASDEGLRAVLWPGERTGRVPLASEPEERPEHPTLVAARRQLEEYFVGERRDFELALDPAGTAFQREAWLALAEIPYGETTTYAAQAARLGRPKAARAVGAANGRNPLSIILPCHRVVGANGHLTGFAGGLDAKRALLEHERRVAAGPQLLVI